MLDVNNLSIAFRTASGMRPTVNNMSFSVARGEILGLVGESGSGKTLMSLGVMGLLPENALVTDGEVLVGGQNILALDPVSLRKLRGRRISMIFQDPMASLDPVFTCGAQLVEAILLHEKIGRKKAAQRAVALLERVLIPDPARAMRAYPHELSGGQCQRIMIAMAVACKPDIIIADEPTTALDVTVQRQVLELLRDLNREVGAAILLITHDLGVIYEVADRVIVMYAGNMMETASTREIFENPQHDYTKALIDSMPSLGRGDGRLPVMEHDGKGGVRSVVRAANVHAAPREPQGSPPGKPTGLPPLLDIRNLTKTWWLRPSPLAHPEPVHAVNDVSLTIAPKTTLGLVGESGCGKSTLSRLVMRLMQADAGAVNFNGRDLVKLKGEELRSVRRDIAMVFQNPYSSLNPRQRVEDLIAAPLVIHSALSSPDRAKRVSRLIEAVNLPQAALKKYPHEFSGGQRQRIVIARALALNPSLVICDEAVSALDVSVQAQVLNLLQDLQAEFVLTYLFISHDLSVVEHISDTIAVMKQGRIVETGTTREIFANPQNDYTRSLLSAVPKIGARYDSRKEIA